MKEIFLNRIFRSSFSEIDFNSHKIRMFSNSKTVLSVGWKKWYFSEWMRTNKPHNNIFVNSSYLSSPRKKPIQQRNAFCKPIWCFAQFPKPLSNSVLSTLLIWQEVFYFVISFEGLFKICFAFWDKPCPKWHYVFYNIERTTVDLQVPCEELFC